MYLLPALRNCSAKRSSIYRSAHMQVMAPRKNNILQQPAKYPFPSKVLFRVCDHSGPAPDLEARALDSLQVRQCGLFREVAGRRGS